MLPYHANWQYIRIVLQQEFHNYRILIDYHPEDNEMLVKFYPKHDQNATPIVIPDGRYDFPSEAFLAKCRLVL